MKLKRKQEIRNTDENESLDVDKGQGDDEDDGATDASNDDAKQHESGLKKLRRTTCVGPLLTLLFMFSMILLLVMIIAVFLPILLGIFSGIVFGPIVMFGYTIFQIKVSYVHFILYAAC